MEIFTAEELADLNARVGLSAQQRVFGRVFEDWWVDTRPRPGMLHHMELRHSGGDFMLFGLGDDDHGDGQTQIEDHKAFARFLLEMLDRGGHFSVSEEMRLRMIAAVREDAE